MHDVRKVAARRALDSKVGGARRSRLTIGAGVDVLAADTTAVRFAGSISPIAVPLGDRLDKEGRAFALLLNAEDVHKSIHVAVA